MRCAAFRARMPKALIRIRSTKQDLFPLKARKTPIRSCCSLAVKIAPCGPIWSILWMSMIHAMHWPGNCMAWMQLSCTCTSDFSYQLELIQRCMIQLLIFFQPMALVFQESVVWGHWKAKLKYLFQLSNVYICWKCAKFESKSDLATWCAQERIISLRQEHDKERSEEGHITSSQSTPELAATVRDTYSYLKMPKVS